MPVSWITGRNQGLRMTVSRLAPSFQSTSNIASSAGCGIALAASPILIGRFAVSILVAAVPATGWTQGKWNDSFIPSQATVQPANPDERTNNRKSIRPAKDEPKKNKQPKAKAVSTTGKADLPAAMAPRNALQQNMNYVAVDPEKIIQQIQSQPKDQPRAYAPANSLDKNLRISRFRIIED